LGENFENFMINVLQGQAPRLVLADMDAGTVARQEQAWHTRKELDSAEAGKMVRAEQGNRVSPKYI
jgi:hypothetical protein